MDKQTLRIKLNEERLSVSAAAITAISQQIITQLEQSVNWGKVMTAHCYSTIPSLKEPDTSGFFEYLWQKHPSVTMYTTRKIFGTWQHGQLTDQGFTATTELPQFDVIIVPVLGFDSNLNRLGYGAGFYDKFLSQQPVAQKIGLAFGSSRVPLVPTEPHDVTLDVIITEYESILSNAD